MCGSAQGSGACRWPVDVVPHFCQHRALVHFVAEDPDPRLHVAGGRNRPRPAATNPTRGTALNDLWGEGVTTLAIPRVSGWITWAEEDHGSRPEEGGGVPGWRKSRGRLGGSQ